MADGTWTSEFWLDSDFYTADFVKAFEAHFPGGEAENQPGVQDARRGYTVFYLHVPFTRKGDIAPFLKRYVETNSAYNEGRPAGRDLSLFP